MIDEKNMTIDEAIAHAREVAEENYKQGFLCHANPNDDELDGCIKCAKEHEQLAEWLEELKQYRAVGTVEKCREAVKNKWIPCSERLPDESGTYIVNAIENRIVHVTFAKWMTRLKKWDLTGSRSYWKVTAWQPLPEPYQTKGQREMEE